MGNNNNSIIIYEYEYTSLDEYVQGLNLIETMAQNYIKLKSADYELTSYMSIRGREFFTIKLRITDYDIN